MRIKLLEDRPSLQKKAGDTFHLNDETKAAALVAAGIAEAAPEADPVTAADVAQSVHDVVKAAVRGAASGAAAGRPEVRVEPVPADDLAGLKIFGSNGGFLHAVRTGAAATNPERDSVEKLAAWEDMQRKAGVGRGGFEAKAPSGNFEANDPDGGVLVVPEFSQQIIERMVAKENFLAETDSIVVRGNTMSFPALSDANRTDGLRSGGILGAYSDEAALLGNVSKTQWRSMDLRLKKLYVFAYMTDELLSDSAYALESYTAGKAADEITFKTNDGLFRGNGAGQPLGFLNATCTISVAKETGQGAATILNLNIEKMWQRLNAYHRQNAVWLVNQDCEAALQQMALPVGIAGVPTYMPVGGVSNPSFATLKGRPVKTVEFAETLGTVGDISLVDWKAYQAITKGGVKTDMSMHVRFTYGEMAYRFTYRFDAQPKYDLPLTPYKGTNTTSPFVTLATRA